MNGPDPASGGTSRLVLTDDDLRRITAAVREGMSRKPDTPKGGSVLRSWTAPVAGFAILLTAWLMLTHWRPSITPRVRATSLPVSEVLDLPAGNRDVRLRIVGAQTQSLTVAGPQNVALPIDLPLTTADCPQLARELGGQCAAAIGTVLVPSSVTVSWTSPQPLKLDPEQPDPANPRPLLARAVRIALDNPAAARIGDSPAPAHGNGAAAPAVTGPQLSIWADTTGAGRTAQRWCYQYTPTAPATLSISVGNRQATRALTQRTAPNVGCDGLHLLVSSGQTVAGTRPLPPLVTLGGVSAIQIHTESTQVNLSALTGNLVLEEDRIKVFETPVAAAIRSDSTIATDLNIQAGTASLALAGHEVTSIDTDEGNLVRTAWQRQKELTVPIFLALVGLMTPLLGAAYKNSFDYLIAEPTLLRRNLRRTARWLWWPFAALGRLVALPFVWLAGRSRRRPAAPPGEAA